MAIDNHTTAGRRPLSYQFQVSGGVAVETLSGDVQLTGKSSQVLRLDPGGAGRNVTLPGAADGVPDSDGLAFEVLNAADAAESLTILDPSGATVCTVAQSEKVRIVGTGGESYAHMGIVSIALT